MKVNIHTLIALLATLTVGMSACTKVDQLFGNGLVPPSQEMSTLRDSSVVIKTYISSFDSVATSNTAFTPHVGTLIDPLVGRSEISFFTNYAPMGFNHTYYFGIDPVIDSMSLGMSFEGAFGDTTKSIEISVYEVINHNFYVDSTYYSNFDMTQYIAPEPLLTFEQKGSGVTVKNLPIEFARRLLDNRQDKQNIYYSDTLFHKKFNGLYFKAKSVSEGEGTMIKMNLPSSVMHLFYRSKNPETQLLDTLSQKLMFMADHAAYNTYFEMMDHDYSYSDQAKGGVIPSQIGDTINESKFAYIQGLGGLMGLVRVDTASIRKVKEAAVAKGYSRVALHKAELQVSIVGQNADNYDDSFSYLGMYFSMEGREFLPEYNPILEAANVGYHSTLGGQLNRSTGQYRFDITSYVQRLITGHFNKYTTQLLPDYGLNAELNRTQVYGSASEHPPLLILTYTLVK